MPVKFHRRAGLQARPIIPSFFAPSSLSVTFYEALGFEKNAQFSDETAACMVWSESIYVMLLTHAKWNTFTNRPIPPATSSEVMLALSCESREEVDLDGHIWEMFWMNLTEPS